MPLVSATVGITQAITKRRIAVELPTEQTSVGFLVLYTIRIVVSTTQTSLRRIAIVTGLEKRTIESTNQLGCE